MVIASKTFGSTFLVVCLHFHRPRQLGAKLWFGDFGETLTTVVQVLSKIGKLPL